MQDRGIEGDKTTYDYIVADQLNANNLETAIQTLHRMSDAGLQYHQTTAEKVIAKMAELGLPRLGADFANSVELHLKSVSPQVWMQILTSSAVERFVSPTLSASREI